MPILQRQNGVSSKNIGRSSQGGILSGASKSRKYSEPASMSSSSSSSQWFKKSLVQLLKDQEWDKVSMRLRSNYGRFEVSRTVKESTLTGSAASAMTKSTTTALHLACQHCAPLDIVQQLIQIHPASLEMYSTNAFGKKRALPLHLACRSYSVACSTSAANLQGVGGVALSQHNNAIWQAMAILEALCRAYPDAIDLSCTHGSKNVYMLPMDIARHYNAPHQLIQVLKQGSEFHRRCNVAHPSNRQSIPLSRSSRENITASPYNTNGPNSPEGRKSSSTYDCDPWMEANNEMLPDLNNSFGYGDEDDGNANYSARNRVTSHDYTAVMDNRGGGDTAPRSRITSLDYTAVVDNRRPCKDKRCSPRELDYSQMSLSPSPKGKTKAKDPFSSPDPTSLTTSTTSYSRNQFETSNNGGLLALRSAKTEDTMDVTTEDDANDDDSCSTLSKSIRFQYDVIPHNSSSSTEENLHCPGPRKDLRGRQISIPLVVEVPIQPSKYVEGKSRVNGNEADGSKQRHNLEISRSAGISWLHVSAITCLFVAVSIYFFHQIQDATALDTTDSTHESYPMQRSLDIADGETSPIEADSRAFEHAQYES